MDSDATPGGRSTVSLLARVVKWGFALIAVPLLVLASFGAVVFLVNLPTVVEMKGLGPTAIAVFGVLIGLPVVWYYTITGIRDIDRWIERDDGREPDRSAQRRSRGNARTAVRGPARCGPISDLIAASVRGR